jgi:guanylate kinase
MPPSIRELERRLLNRGTDDPSGISTRIKKAAEEMTMADQFDNIVINDKLDIAKKDIFNLVTDFLEKNNDKPV